MKNFKDWLKDKYNNYKGPMNDLACQCPCKWCSEFKDCSKCDCENCDCKYCKCKYNNNMPKPIGSPPSGEMVAKNIMHSKHDSISGPSRRDKWADWWHDHQQHN